MFKRIIPVLFLLALFAGPAQAITATGSVDSLAAWDSLRVRIATASEAPDSVVGYKLWNSGTSDFSGSTFLWGTIAAAAYTDPDSLLFGALLPFTKHYFKWEVLSYDTTLATGSRTTLKHTYSAIFSGYTSHPPIPGLVAFDSTNTQVKFTIDLPIVAPDSGVLVWDIYTSTDSVTWAWGDSATAINGTSDTSGFIGTFYNGTEIFAYVVAQYQDTTQKADTLAWNHRPTHTYTSAVIACTTKTIGQTIASVADSLSYRNFLIKDTHFGTDSLPKKIYVRYRVKGVTAWTLATAAAVWANLAVGRDSSALGPDSLAEAEPWTDTLWCLTGGKAWSGPGDLLPGTIYEVQAVLTDSVSSDTSNTLEITTSTMPGKPTGYAIDTTQGEVASGIWHFATSYNKLNQTWTGPKFNVNGYKKIIFEVQKFGFDNNHPGDSSKLYLMHFTKAADVGYAKLDSALFNGLSGGYATAATGVMALPDTASGRKTYTLSVSEVRTVARAANDTTFINAYNPEWYFYHAPKDSAGNFGASLDTTTLDRIYIDIWGYGIK